MKFRMPYALVSLLLLLAPSMSFAQMTSYEDDPTQYIPAPDEFVPVDEHPGIDMEEIQANLVYPAEALEQRIEGRVVVTTLINWKGEASRSFVVTSTNELFNQPAIDAVEKSMFTPALQGDQPVNSWIMIPVKFMLPSE